MSKQKLSKEIVALAHQVADEFSVGFEGSTQIQVDSKDPKKMIKLLIEDEVLPYDEKIPKYFFLITISEEGTSWSEYGYDDDPLKALFTARDKMRKLVKEIYDQSTTNARRNNEVNAIVSGSDTLH